MESFKVASTKKRNKKYYHISGDIPETSATIMDFKDARVVIPNTDPFSSVWSVWKTKGLWRMTFDNQNIPLVVTMNTVIVPDVVSSLEKINKFPVTWYTSFDLRNAFVSVPVHKDHQKLFPLSWQSQKYTFTVLSQGYINCLALGYHLLEGLLIIFFSKDISVVQHMNDILMTGPR